jgi:hypothetical protein
MTIRPARSPISLALLLLIVGGCTQSAIVPLGPARPATRPDDVRIYLEPPPGRRYEILALLTAHSATGWTQAQDTEKALRKLKQQAASVGANGVLLDSMSGPAGSRPYGAVIAGPGGVTTITPTDFSPSSEALFRGRAIWVQPE